MNEMTIFIAHVYTRVEKLKNKRSMVGTITWETKRKSQRKAKRQTSHKNQKRERASPSRGRKLFHPRPL
jgi:hypothetical protein